MLFTPTLLPASTDAKIALSNQASKVVPVMAAELTSNTSDAPAEDPSGHTVTTRFQRFLHFWKIVIQAFIANRCPVRASALAYSNLLAIVPILAVILSVTSGLLKQEGQDKIEVFIQQFVDNVTPGASNPLNSLAEDSRAVAARKEVAGRIKEFIDNTRSGTLGVTGIIALLFVGIGMLVRIENTFNDIWGITRGRRWVARVLQYWGAMTLGPLLLVSAIALTSTAQFKGFTTFLSDLPLGVGQGISFLFKLLPFVILIITFALFYMVMPNTRVDWRAALFGGLVGGTLWQINNLFSVLYVSRVVTNSKIYGSLGMVPVVMIGLYFSWIILLFGAQVAYVFQNRKAYQQEKQLETYNVASREFIALRIMTLVGKAFASGHRNPNVALLADQLSAPTRLVTQVVQSLIQGRILVEVTQPEPGFSPARPLTEITAKDILDALRIGTGQDPALSHDPSTTPIRLQWTRIRQAEQTVSDQVTLQDLVTKT